MKNLISKLAVCCTVALAAVSCSVKIENPADAPEKQLETRSLAINLDGTRINSVGTTMRWNTSAESMAVIGKKSGEVRIYKFTKSGDQGSTPAASRESMSINAFPTSSEG